MNMRCALRASSLGLCRSALSICRVLSLYGVSAAVIAAGLVPPLQATAATPTRDEGYYTGPAGNSPASFLGGPMADPEMTVIRENYFESTAPDTTGSGLTLSSGDADRDGKYAQSVFFRCGPHVTASSPACAGTITFYDVTIIGIIRDRINLEATETAPAKWGRTFYVDYAAPARETEEAVAATDLGGGVTKIDFTLWVGEGYTDDFRVLIDYGTSFPESAYWDVDLTTGVDINTGASDGGSATSQRVWLIPCDGNLVEDTDRDGLCNNTDPDNDNDGVLDGPDAKNNNPDICEDADGDTCDDCAGTHDGLGPLPNNDTNDDGTDTDGDGACDAGDTDDDGDGFSDDDETTCGSLPLDGSPVPVDTDGDGLCDAGVDTDDDNDGVSDVDETNAGTGPTDPLRCGDSDGDSCDDCSLTDDLADDGADADPGNDGPDTDGDGICDAGDPDDDNDGFSDEDETACGTLPRDDTSEPGDLDGDGVCDLLDVCVGTASSGDTDSDGICDDLENDIGTDAGDADSDDDGVPDGDEERFDEDADQDGLINALDPDSDNDGLYDGTEVGVTSVGLDPATDVAAGQFIPDADPSSHTDPLRSDTDSGGVSALERGCGIGTALRGNT